MVTRAAWTGIIASTALLVGMGGLWGQAVPTSASCTECHLTLEDSTLSDPARLFEEDIHARAGFGCLDCHGAVDGIPDRTAGFLAAPRGASVPRLCGRCHSDAVFMRRFAPTLRVDQEAEYWSSSHGRRLRSVGDTAVATCTDCHRAHQIRPADEPESDVHALRVPQTCGRCHSDSVRMGRTVASDPVEAWASSVHGALLLDGDVAAPACNDCHGNHGAAPPGVAAVRFVCGQCHSVMAEFFASSGHVELFEDAQLPGCATCHEHHRVEAAEEATLERRSVDVCFACHEDRDEKGGEFARMHTVLDSLSRAESSARDRLHEAEMLGMEVSQALFELEDVTNARNRARSAVHTFRADAVGDEVRVGLQLTDAALTRGDEALSEHRFRRVGLGVSAAFIGMMVIGLLLRIRDVERASRAFEARAHAMVERMLVQPGPTRRRMEAVALYLEVRREIGAPAVTADEASTRARDWGVAPDHAALLADLVAEGEGTGSGNGRFSTWMAWTGDTQELRDVVAGFWALARLDPVLSSREADCLTACARLLPLDVNAVARARREVPAPRPHPHGETLASQR